MLKVKNLTKVFPGKTALDHIHFEVRKGVVTGLLGPNGAGKTTTMRLLTGFMEPTEGSISYGEKDFLENQIDIKKDLGYLPESAPLYPEMTIREYLGYIARIRGISEEGSAEAVHKMVELCELESHLDTLIGVLSKGFRQRVALAGTLIHNPSVIILDEPTSGLDPNQIGHIRSLIKKLGKEKTVILSTHILQEVEDVCDDVIIISKGKIVANSSVKGLYKGHGVLITVKASLDEVRKFFSGKDFTGAEEFAEDGLPQGYTTYLVNLPEDRPESVFNALKNSSFPVREIKIFKRSLSSIFEELTK